MVTSGILTSLRRSIFASPCNTDISRPAMSDFDMVRPGSDLHAGARGSAAAPACHMSES
jgi:hypothetical protein